MYVWKQSDASVSMTISGDVYMPISQQSAVGVLTSLIAMNTLVPLTRVVVSKVASGQYNYVITTLDNRKWNQDIYLIDGQVYMTFNINDLWRSDEFALQRPVRDNLTYILQNYNIERIVVNWT